jgi:hypothetical protein
VPSDALESCEADPFALALPFFPLFETFASCEAFAELLVFAFAPDCDAETDVCDDAEPEVCVLAEVCATAAATSKLDASKPEIAEFISILLGFLVITQNLVYLGET